MNKSICMYLKGNTQEELAWTSAKFEQLVGIIEGTEPVQEIPKPQTEFWFEVDGRFEYESYETNDLEKAKTMPLEQYPSATYIKTRDKE